MADVDLPPPAPAHNALRSLLIYGAAVDVVGGAHGFVREGCRNLIEPDEALPTPCGNPVPVWSLSSLCPRCADLRRWIPANDNPEPNGGGP